MNVTNVKLFPSNKQDSVLKAYGKATIENKLSLDILIMDKGDGTGAWVTFPGGRKNETNGKFYLPVFFVDEDTRNTFNSRVLSEYENISAPAAQNTDGVQQGLPF